MVRPTCLSLNSVKNDLAPYRNEHVPAPAERGARYLGKAGKESGQSLRYLCKLALVADTFDHDGAVENVAPKIVKSL